MPLLRYRFAAISGHVPDTSILSSRDVVVRKLLESQYTGQRISGHNTHHSLNLHRICAWCVALQALPLGHPAALGIGHCNHTLEDSTCAVLYDVGVVTHLEELFAVRAAAGDEFGAGLDDGADHAGA
jgi:hypothetical protein